MQLLVRSSGGGELDLHARIAVARHRAGKPAQPGQAAWVERRLACAGRRTCHPWQRASHVHHMHCKLLHHCCASAPPQNPSTHQYTPGVSKVMVADPSWVGGMICWSGGTSSNTAAGGDPSRGGETRKCVVSRRLCRCAGCAAKRRMRWAPVQQHSFSGTAPLSTSDRHGSSGSESAHRGSLHQGS